MGLALVAVVVVSLVSASAAFAAAGPVVTHVRAATGPTTGGTTVTITGKNFMSSGKSTVKKVLFGIKAASHVRVASATKLTVNSPSHAAGVVNVRVVSKSGAMSAKAKTDRYSYFRPLPTITALLPTSGPIAGGTVVTITGTHLTGATVVTFGGVPAASFSVVNDATITAVSPAYTPLVPNTNTGIYVMVLTQAGLTDASFFGAYTYTVPSTSSGAPTVTAVSPNGGPDAGGTAVTITGTNFSGATEVDFGSGNPATSLVAVSSTQITCVTPAGAGVVDVTVTNAKGPSAPSAPPSMADWFEFS